MITPLVVDPAFPLRYAPAVADKSPKLTPFHADCIVINSKVFVFAGCPPPPYTPLVLFPAPYGLPTQAVNASPKSLEFPVDAIVINSIVLIALG